MFDVIPVTSSIQVDCGPTCLKMLLAYYDIDVPLEDLIAECNTRVIGCSGADLMRVARAHGMDDVKAFRMDAAELVRQDRPAIIWWKYQHWCVFCGQNDAGQVVIVNPDRGMYPLDKESFSCMYTGVAIFNGDPEDLPESEEATAADYEQALSNLGVSL